MNNKEQILIINRFCDDFESRLKSGEDTSCDEFLESAKKEVNDEKLIQSLLSELIALEILYSDDRSATADSLRSRFPEHDSDIDEALIQRSLLGTIGEDANDTEADGRSAAPGPVAPIAFAGSRFENLKHHASGGLGDVYIGFDKSVRRKAAIKLLKPKLVANESAKKRFLNEGAITAMLEHPGIVPVYDAGATEDGQPFYAMRLLEGQTLKDAINELHGAKDKANFSVQQRSLLRSLMQVCDAVSYAHDQGVIHRDLKPANILIGKYGETTVVDWGLARNTRSTQTQEHFDESKRSDGITDGAGVVTELGRIIGTPAFMSPEQASGDSSKVGKQSDVYSLGAVLYCILTGQSPLSGAAAITQEIIEKVQTGNYLTARERESSVPAGLDAICERAMSVEQLSRYDSPKELASEIENWLEDRPVLARPDNAVEKFSRFVRKYRGWSAATAITLLTVAVGATIAATVIGSQSAELVTRKAEAEKQAKVQTELATKEKQSAQKATEEKRNNAAYVDLMHTVFDSLLRKNNLGSQENKDVHLTDFVATMQSELKSREESIPLVTKRQILRNVVSGLVAAGENEKALGPIDELIELSTKMGGASVEFLEAKAAKANSLKEIRQHREALALSGETLDLIRSNEFSPEQQALIDAIEDGVLDTRLSCLKELGGDSAEIVSIRERLQPWVKEVNFESLPRDVDKLHVINLYVDERLRAGEDIDVLQWQKQIYAAQKEVGGAKDPIALGGLYRLSQAVRSKQGATASLPYQIDLVDLAIEVLGADHVNTMTARANLANTFATLGRHEEALNRFSRQRDELSLNGELVERLYAIESKLARSQLYLGMTEQALKLLKEVVPKTVSNINIGPLHKTAINAKYRLVIALIESSQIEEAIKLAETEIEMLLGAGDANKTDVADTRALLQRAYLSQGNFKKALQFQELFAKEISNENIVPIAQTAEALCGLQRWDEAKGLIEKALATSPADKEDFHSVEASKCMKANLKGLMALALSDSDPEKAKLLYRDAISKLEAGCMIKMPNTWVKQPLIRFRKQLKKLEELKDQS